MEIDELMTLLYSRFTERYQASVYCLEGQIFTPPKDAPWCRVIVRTDDSKQKDLAKENARIRATGRVWVQLFSPIMLGPGPLEVMYLAIKPKTGEAIFERFAAPGLQCRASSFTQLGEEDGYHAAKCVTKFWFDRFSAS